MGKLNRDRENDAWTEMVCCLAMDSGAHLDDNVCEGVRVGFAASRNSNLEHIGSEVVSFSQQVLAVLVIYWWAKMRNSNFGAQFFSIVRR